MARDDYPIEYDDFYGCWLWQGKLSTDGYPLVTSKGWRTAYAHRHVYEQEGGTIPAKHFLDHLCRRRSCVNPGHLQPVKQRENERRKAWKRRVKITECPKGHDLYMNGRLTPEGGKVCRLCSGVLY